MTAAGTKFEDRVVISGVGQSANRHLAFGAGPHRCAGSNLARMNLRIALDEMLPRLCDLELQAGADICFHSTFNRAPRAVPITFTPGSAWAFPPADARRALRRNPSTGRRGRGRGRRGG